MCLISGRIYEINDSLSEYKPCWKCLPNDSVSDWSWGTYLSQSREQDCQVFDHLMPVWFPNSLEKCQIFPQAKQVLWSLCVSVSVSVCLCVFVQLSASTSWTWWWMSTKLGRHWQGMTLTSDQTLILIWFRMWIQGHFFIFLDITR